MGERPTSSFGANTEKNPKEECKAVLTRSQRRAQGEQRDERDRYEEVESGEKGEVEEN